MTEIGKYLQKLKTNKTILSRQSGISTSRINAISHDEDSKPYAEEFFKIIYLANQQSGLGDKNFKIAIEEIYPNRKKINLLADFEHFSPEGKFFKKYTQKQNEIEEKLGITKGKLSKYFGDNTKRALALEIINFAEGLELDVLETFKEIYGEIKIN